MKQLKSLFVAALLAPALTLAVVPVRAADFSGETVEWTVPFKEGGGTSRVAQFYAPMLARHLPGRPDVVVKNVPGGGSTTGANQFAERAKPDGLHILITSGSTQFPFLLGDSRVRYDYANWTVVLGSPTGGVAYVSPDLGAKSAADLGKLKGRRLVYGSQGATSLDLIPLLAFELLGLEVEAVFGMKSRGEGRLAYERGESNIDYQTSSAYLKNVVPLVGEGKAVPLMSWGALDDGGNLVRDPTFPDLPHFAEIYEAGGGDMNSRAFKAWKAFFAAGFPAQKMVFVPKETPPETVAAYHRAFAAVFESDEFKSKAGKSLGKYQQVTGGGAETLKRIATTIEPSARDWVRGWLEEKYNVKF